MTSVLDDTIDVHYGFLFLSATGEPENDFGRAGQTNGLCGAAAPGQLSMTTGTHTGSVAVRVEWSTDEPVLDESWDEIVEVSWDVPATSLVLSAFEVYLDVALPSAGSHRARWSASGMQEAREAEYGDEDADAPDRYLLHLWPAPAEPDRIVKQTSEIAAYWHGVARDER